MQTKILQFDFDTRTRDNRSDLKKKNIRQSDLHHPDHEQEFIVYSDTSEEATEITLCQEIVGLKKTVSQQY